MLILYIPKSFRRLSVDTIEEIIKIVVLINNMLLIAYFETSIP